LAKKSTQVISGIVHVLKSGCRWKDCPAAYGPPTTVYNRFNRWSRRGLWGRIFAELVAQAELADEISIDSTAVRAHRSAHGGKGGRRFRPSGARVAVRPRKSTR
jgi:transposase